MSTVFIWISNGFPHRNTRAYFINKLVDFDDWQVTEDVFKDLDSLWVPHTVDCFIREKSPDIVLDFGNVKHRCIYAVVGSREFLVSPPVYLIPRALAYMNNQGVKGTLVVPL